MSVDLPLPRKPLSTVTGKCSRWPIRIPSGDGSGVTSFFPVCIPEALRILSHGLEGAISRAGQGAPADPLIQQLLGMPDHWALAVPVARAHPLFGSTLIDKNDYPREAFMEAMLRYLDETLQ